MMGTRKYLCYVLLALIFLSFFSIGGTSGCGSPHYDGERVDTGSGSTSGNNNNSTNNNTNNDSTDSNNNGGGNSGTAVNISGTWKIVDGNYTMSDDGKMAASGTYVQGSVDSLQITMGESDSNYFAGFYSMTLTGKNVIGSGAKGAGSVIITFKLNDSDDNLQSYLYCSPFFVYDGENTYTTTEKERDSFMEGQLNAYSFKNTVTLVNNSTLKWSYWTKSNPDTLSFTREIYQEITLRRVK